MSPRALTAAEARNADWTLSEAKKAAGVYRAHGLTVRVVRCRLYDSYLRIYREDGDGLGEARKLAKVECQRQGIDNFEMVVRI